jgi:Cu+-exporting ATPase
LFISAAGRVEGVFGLQDPVREEIRPAVQGMMDAGYDLALLAGESRGTVEALALALDIANTRPEVLPDDRGAAVRAIADVGGAVAVVGRPQRDGGALGAADVAISLAAAGESGGETAVALAGDDLRDAAAALLLARAARDRIARILTVAVIGSAVAAGLVSFVPGAGAFSAAVAGVAVVATVWLASRDGSDAKN